MSSNQKSPGSGSPKLPKQQLTILAICRFAEPIASTSLFPYLPEMIASFSIPIPQIGFYAGLCSATFSLAQATFAVPWGRFSDLHGRKPAILVGLCCTLLTSLLWGFSPNLWVAVAARGLAGAANGNVGILRTTVAEMVPFRELQPRAFSIMPLVWSVGSIFGPMLGGVLANPYGVEAGERGEGGLLRRFPYALPNVVSAVLFLVGIVTGVLFLEETMEEAKGRRDVGLEMGVRVKRAGRVWSKRARRALGMEKGDDGEEEPLLKPAHGADDEEAHADTTPTKTTPPPPPPSYREILNPQAILNLFIYTLLCLHTMAYDQLLPVFLQHPGPPPDQPPATNPLNTTAGFGLHHFTIGLLVTAYALLGMAVQFFLFPPLANRYGIPACTKTCALAFPLAYLLTPLTPLLPTPNTRLAALFATMLLKGFAAIFAFPCVTISLTNSAGSLRTLGALNGLATSTSAIGRALGPAIGGSLFTFGVQRGSIVVPFWVFALIACAAVVPIWFLEDKEGFGGDEGEGGDGDGDERAGAGAERGDDVGVVATSPGRDDGAGGGASAARPVDVRAGGEGGERRGEGEGEGEGGESAYGEPGRLTRAGTAGTVGSLGASCGARRGSLPMAPGRRYSTQLGASLGSQGSLPGTGPGA